MNLGQQLMDANKATTEPVKEEEVTVEPSTTEEEIADPSHEGETPEETTEEAEATEEETTDNTQVEEDVPFHKHPRFKELIEERKQLREEMEEMRRLVEEKSQPTQVEVPDWFQAQFGEREDLPQLYTQYQEEVKKQEEDFAKRVEERILSKQKAEEQEQEKLLTWVDTELERVEKAAEKKLTQDVRNAVLKVAEEFQPLDNEGNIDLLKAYKIYELEAKAKQTEVKQKTDERKKIVSQATDVSKAQEPSSRVIPGPHSFANGLTAALQQLNK